MADKTANEGKHTEGLEGGLATLGVVLECETDDLPVVVSSRNVII